MDARTVAVTVAKAGEKAWGAGKALVAKRLKLEHAPENMSLSDRIYYERIVEAVPEIGSYKKDTARFVHALALERGYANFKDYFNALRFDEGERAYLKTHLTNKGTHFFRGDDWEFFNEACLSTFAGKTGIKVWCAGCSSGEEAYSVVMSLLDYVSPGDIDVLASDYSDELLAKCNAASYFNMHLEEVPEKYRHHLDLGEKKFSIKQDVREVVHTQNINLVTDEYPSSFDIVVCRNVMKFFSPDVIARVKEGLVAALNPGGFLFVSTDDNHKGVELIERPHSQGLRRMGERGIYEKVRPGEQLEADDAKVASLTCGRALFADAPLQSQGPYHIDEVKPDAALKADLANTLPEVIPLTQRSDFDLAFVCGLLQWKQPKKIVQVGVASGGVTAAMMMRLEQLGHEYTLYAVDRSPHPSAFPDKPTGFAAEQACRQLGVQNFELLVGDVLPERLERIGAGIDFLLLDASPSLPDDVLDFLAAYPYLAEGAVVCVRGVRENLKGSGDNRRVGANVLMSCVVGEKIVGTDPARSHGYPNIGAFVVEPETGRYSTNVFSALMQCWMHVPTDTQLESYERAFERSYGEEELWVYHCAVALNKDCLNGGGSGKQALRLVRKVVGGARKRLPKRR